MTCFNGIQLHQWFHADFVPCPTMLLDIRLDITGYKTVVSVCLAISLCGDITGYNTVVSVCLAISLFGDITGYKIVVYVCLSGHLTFRFG